MDAGAFQGRSSISRNYSRRNTALIQMTQNRDRLAADARPFDVDPNIISPSPVAEETHTPSIRASLPGNLDVSRPEFWILRTIRRHMARPRLLLNHEDYARRPDIGQSIPRCIHGVRIVARRAFVFFTRPPPM